MTVIANTRYELHNLAVLLNEIQDNRKNGRLTCQDGQQRAYVYVEQGEIVHATLGTLTGEGVLYTLLSWPQGSVIFEEKGSAANYDNSRTIERGRAFNFIQTLEVFQPAPTNIALTLPELPDLGDSFDFSPSFNGNMPSSNGNGYAMPTPAPMPAPVAAPVNNFAAPGHNFTPAPAPAPKVSLGRPKMPGQHLLRLPLPKSMPDITLTNTSPLDLIKQASSAAFTGCLTFDVMVRGQSEEGLLLMEGGKLIMVRYALTDFILTEQAAYEALVTSCSQGQATVSMVACSPNWLKTFMALQSSKIVQANSGVTISYLLQLVQEAVQKNSSVALKIVCQGRTFYYLLGEGEALGYFECKDEQHLVAMLIPLSQLDEKAGIRFEMHIPTRAEEIMLEPRPVASYLPPSPNGFSLPEVQNGNSFAMPEMKNGNGYHPPAAMPTTELTKAPVVEPVKPNQPTGWQAILEKGRRPYSNLPATTTNFNGLRRAFEQKSYTGLIELALPDNAYYYLVEKGLPLGIFKLDPSSPQPLAAGVSVFDILDKPNGVLNVYLEENKAFVQQIFEDYMQALYEGTFNRAVQVVQEALRAGIKSETIYDLVFTQAMRRVGEMWETGKMSIAQEHLATGITEYCRSLVMSSTTIVPVKRVGSVLLTSVSGNTHTLGLSLLGDVFRWHGWEVFPLFSELPEVEIVETVLRQNLDMVCLSVSLPGQIVVAVKVIKALKQSGWQGITEVGGAAFLFNPDAFKATGADFLGGDAEATVEEATRRLQAKRQQG